MALSVGKYTSTKGAISIYVCSPKNTHNWMELPFTDFHMDHKFMGQRNGFILKLAEIFNLIGGIF